MNPALTLQFNNLGRTGEADDNTHIRDMIEQVLFTSPGERVNRPDFGSGLLQLVFQPNSSELAATLQFLVQGSLRQWLGDLIEVNDVQVLNDDSILKVTVVYSILKNRQIQTAQFTR